jgi:hypothetical protein
MEITTEQKWLKHKAHNYHGSTQKQITTCENSTRVEENDN